jgi:hypothetical protein
VRASGLVALLAVGCAHQIVGHRVDNVAVGGLLRYTLERDGDYVDLYVDNEYAAPVTIDFLMSASSLHGGPPVFTAVIDAAPHGTHQRVAEYMFNINGGRARIDWKTTVEFGDPRATPTSYDYAPPIAGATPSSRHDGDDQFAFDYDTTDDTPILAVRDGVVVAFNDSGNDGPGDTLRNRSRWIVVRHDDGTIAEYLHIATGGVRVRPGDLVKRGQVIARAATGFIHVGVLVPKDGHHHRTIPMSRRP